MLSKHRSSTVVQVLGIERIAKAVVAASIFIAGLSIATAQPSKTRIVEFQPRVKWSGRVNAVATHPDRPYNVLVATPTGGLFRSIDGGDRWSRISGLPAWIMSDVKMHPLKPDVIVATAARDFAVIEEPMVRSGASVNIVQDPVLTEESTILTEGVLSSELGLEDLDRSLNGLAVRTSGGGIWISDDGGSSWTRPPSAVPLAQRAYPNLESCRPDYSAHGIEFDNQTGDIIIGTDCGVAISRNLGKTWEHHSLPGRAFHQTVYSVAALGNGVFLAAGSVEKNQWATAAIWASTDSGNTWYRDRTAPGMYVSAATRHAFGDLPKDGEALFATVDALYHLKISGKGASAQLAWSKISHAPMLSRSTPAGGFSFAKAYRGTFIAPRTKPSDKVYIYLGNRYAGYVATGGWDTSGSFVVDRLDGRTGTLSADYWKPIRRLHDDVRDIVAITERPTASGGTEVRDVEGNLLRSYVFGGEVLVNDGGRLAAGSALKLEDTLAWFSSDGGLERHGALPKPSSGIATAAPTTYYDRPKSPVLVESGPGRINALQIYEVDGQAVQDEKEDHLYFGTQDNDLWASFDGGKTWPKRTRAEGQFLAMLPKIKKRSEAVITYKGCSANCTAKTGAGFEFDKTGANEVEKWSKWDWNDPVNNDRSKRVHGKASGPPMAPQLVEGTTYVQTDWGASTGNKRNLYVTKDLGKTWTLAAGFGLRSVRDRPVPAKIRRRVRNGFNHEMGVYQAVTMPSLVTQYQGRTVHLERMTLARVHDIQSASNQTPRFPKMDNFGSLGTLPVEFGWYMVFGVEPKFGAHIIAPDVLNYRMMQSFDGGDSWQEMPDLTRLLTGNGQRRFVSPSVRSLTELNGNHRNLVINFPLVTQISFNPFNSNIILIGTQQGGIYQSFDRGRTWAVIPGSGAARKVSSFHWNNGNEVTVSTYGSGLFKIHLGPVVGTNLQSFSASVWGEACRRGECVFMDVGGSIEDTVLLDQANVYGAGTDRIDLVFDGAITAIDADDDLLSVRVSPGGTIVSFGVTGDGSDLVIKHELEHSTFNVPRGRLIPESGYQLIGIVRESGALKGYVLAPGDLAMPQEDEDAFVGEGQDTPDFEGEPMITLSSNASVNGLASVSPDMPSFVVNGADFEAGVPVRIYVGGREVDGVETIADEMGYFETEIRLNAFPIGQYGVLAVQGDIEQVATLMIRHKDEEESDRAEQ